MDKWIYMYCKWVSRLLDLCGSLGKREKPRGRKVPVDGIKKLIIVAEFLLPAFRQFYSILAHFII